MSVLECVEVEVSIYYTLLIITISALPFCIFVYADTLTKQNRQGNRWGLGFVVLSLFIATSWRLVLFGFTGGAMRYWAFAGYLFLICAWYGIVRLVFWITKKLRFVPLPLMLIATTLIVMYCSGLKLFRNRNNIIPQQMLLNRAWEICPVGDKNNCVVIFHYKLDERLSIPGAMAALSLQPGNNYENTTFSEIQALVNYRTVFHIYRYKLKDVPSNMSLVGDVIMSAQSRRNRYYLCKGKRNVRFLPCEKWTNLNVAHGGEKIFSEYEISLLESNKLRQELFRGFQLPNDWAINIAHMWGEHCYPFSSRIIAGQWKITSRDWVNFYMKTPLPKVEKNQCVVVCVKTSAEGGASLGVGVYPATRNYTMIQSMPINNDREYMYFFIPHEPLRAPNPRLFIYSIGAINISEIKYQVLNLSDDGVLNGVHITEERVLY